MNLSSPTPLAQAAPKTQKVGDVLKDLVKPDKPSKPDRPSKPDKPYKPDKPGKAK